MNIRSCRPEDLLGEYVRIDGCEWMITEVRLTLDCTLFNLEAIKDCEVKCIVISRNELARRVEHEEAMASRKVRGF